ncbi:MAG: asparagine synthase-related protein [Candidatus Thermoplasmatota archaeon]
MDAERLLKLLRISVRECVASSGSVAVAYSGGVDSALVERVARECAETRAYTCAVRGSHDHSRAPTAAEEEGADLRMLALDEQGLMDAVRKTAAALGTSDPLRVAYTVPVVCVIDSCEESVVLVGSGADELFGGYAKYADDAAVEASMERDLGKMLAEHALLRGYASSLGKRLEAPFASPEIVSFAKSLPLDRKLGGGNRKAVLRDAARSLGVVSHDAPKKAAQYSSGVMKEMKRLAKARGMGLGAWTDEAAAGRRIP